MFKQLNELRQGPPSPGEPTMRSDSAANAVQKILDAIEQAAMRSARLTANWLGGAIGPEGY